MDLAKRRRERLQGLDVAPMPALATVAPVSVGTAYVPQARADTAVDELGVPAPGHALVCLTAGQWSLIDLVRAVIERAGPARLRLSTWTTGVRDAENAAWLLSTGALTGLQVFTDASFPVREPEYCHRLVRLWGLDAMVVTQTHAKIATIRAPGFDLAIASSMNLNRNPRFENADLFHVPAVADLYDRWFDDIAATGVRLDTPRDEVGAAFQRMAGSAPEVKAAPETAAGRLARLRASRGARK